MRTWKKCELCCFDLHEILNKKYSTAHMSPVCHLVASADDWL